MAGPDNAKNELLEMSAANAWPAPQFAYVPGDVNPFRCQVTQVVPMRAAPFVATGISCMTNKGAEKEAAAVMLAEVADYFAQQVGGCDGCERPVLCQATCWRTCMIPLKQVHTHNASMSSTRTSELNPCGSTRAGCHRQRLRRLSGQHPRRHQLHQLAARAH